MKNVLEKLFKIQQELKVPKNQRNTFGNYNFRNCEDIMEASKPVCAKLNCLLTCSDEIIVVGEHNPYLYEEIYYDKDLKKENKKTSSTGYQRFYVQATATLYDLESGESISTTACAREEETKKGMDASQITGASSSYARKYALNGLLQLDDNKDADTNEFSRQQRNQSNNKNSQQKNQVATKEISEDQKKLINTLLSKCDDSKSAKEELYNHFKITTIKGISSDLAKQMIDYLNKKVGA